MSGELLCERCGQNHPIWYTDNKSWNEVVRDNSSNFVFNFLCPSCFCFLAFVHYREVSFKVTLERAADNKEPVQQSLTQAKAAETLPEGGICCSTCNNPCGDPKLSRCDDCFDFSEWRNKLPLA